MKHKPTLVALAAIGLVAGSVGLVMAAQAPAKTCEALTQSEISAIFAKIDKEHQEKFKALDCEGQHLAMMWINQSCKGKNSCKGLNTCKSDTNSCAGKGSCKGTSPGPFKDKNEAVDKAADAMADKRMKAQDQ